MEKENKRLIIEIISITIMLIIMVPICVNASNKYQEEKSVLLEGKNTFVDIINNNDSKKVTIYCNYNKPMKVKLTMKINDFSNNYLINLDNQVYDLQLLEYTLLDGYRYYNLGIYEVNQKKEFNFKINVKEKAYYSENLVYSFTTEGQL